MSYDMILVGGTGAQFGQAVLESVGMGILEPPRATYLIDADDSFEQVLTAAYKKFVIEPGPSGGDGSGSSKQTAVPTIERLPPYLHPRPNFTILDLLGGTSLSALGSLCISEEEASHSVAEGLYGMAKLGGVVVGIDRALGVKAKDSFPRNIIERLVASADASPIVLAGSVAGGTGAGFLTPLLHAMRSEPKLAHRPIYVFIFLPWFSLPSRAGAVGPNNLRMNRNASQGIRYAQRVMGLQSIRENPAATYTILFGLPPSAAKPVRTKPDMRSEPGPLLYYAASLMSGNFEVFSQARIAYGLPSGILAVRCNSPGKPIFARRVRFTIEINRQQGAAPEIVQVPFEAAHALLTAQERALRNLAKEDRYVNAFGKFLNNPEYLPGVLYRTLKDGRNSTGERHELGKRLAVRFREMAEDLHERANRLQATIAAERGNLEFDDLGQTADRIPVVEDWWDKKLDTMEHLDEVIRRTREIEARVKNAIATNQVEAAARLVSQSMRLGLASGPATIVALKRYLHDDQQPTALALPCADIQVEGRSGLPFVSLEGRVEQLARALVGTDQPDSQCVPSPLAKAHIIDYFCSSVEQIDPVLAASPVGRTLLTFCGLSTGALQLAERIYLGGSPDKAEPFLRTVILQEELKGDNPVRSDWMTIIRSREEKKVVAATSPRTGVFYGVRVDETEAGPLLDLFRDLEQNLNAKKQVDVLRALYAVLLDDVLGRHAGARDYPWCSALRRWTEGVPLGAARQTFAENAYYALGPFPLQVGQDPNGNALMDWVWLPQICPLADRERMASILASVAIAVGPVVQSVRDEHSVRLEAKQPPTQLLELRPFSRGGVPLSIEEELRAGALEILACTTEVKPARAISYAWLPIRDSVRLKLQNMQRTPNVQLSAAWIVRLLLASQPAVCADLGLDEAKADTLSNCTPGPFAPGICNLFASLQLK